MIENIISEILPDVWPMLIIITVILATLRIAYLIKSHKKVSFYKEILTLIFGLYIMCLFHVVTFQDVNYGVSNYIPFKEIFRYSIGSSKFIKNILGNILLFIPYGFFVAYYLKPKKIYGIFILTTIVSFTIESVQYYIGRVFDIDDIILNIVGGIIGYLIYIAVEAIRRKLPKLFKSDTFLNIIIIIIIIVIIIYSFNLNILSWL